MRIPILLVVVAVAVGCSKRGSAVVVSLGPSDQDCVDVALQRSRLAGYIETLVDKGGRFFRVTARTASTGRPLANLGMDPARAVYFQVQCQGTEARVSAVDAKGPYETRSMKNEVRAELDSFAASLGVQVGVAVSAEQGPCVASELPAWATATAAEKKALMEQCKSQQPQP